LSILWSALRTARKLLFSGNQLHASILNTSGRARFSVDFRTVDVADLMTGRGAPLLDVHCTGAAIRDFINVANEAAFDERTVVKLFGAPPADAMLVFGASGRAEFRGENDLSSPA
jgi:hypothetical protein